MVARQLIFTETTVEPHSQEKKYFFDLIFNLKARGVSVRIHSTMLPVSDHATANLLTRRILIGAQSFRRWSNAICRSLLRPANTESELFFTMAAMRKFSIDNTRFPTGRTQSFAGREVATYRVRPSPERFAPDQNSPCDRSRQACRRAITVFRSETSNASSKCVRDKYYRDAARFQILNDEIEEILLLLGRERSPSVRRR